MVAGSPYGELYDLYCVSPEYFGYHLAKGIGQKRKYAAEIRTWKLSNKKAQPENSTVSAHVRLQQVS
jgi:hypothetical protein